LARICSLVGEDGDGVSSQGFRWRGSSSRSIHYDVDPIWLGGMVCPDANLVFAHIHGILMKPHGGANSRNFVGSGCHLRSRIGGSERSLGDSFESETRVTHRSRKRADDNTDDVMRPGLRQGIWSFPAASSIQTPPSLAASSGFHTSSNASALCRMSRLWPRPFEDKDNRAVDFAFECSQFVFDVLPIPNLLVQRPDANCRAACVGVREGSAKSATFFFSIPGSTDSSARRRSRAWQKRGERIERQFAHNR